MAEIVLDRLIVNPLRDLQTVCNAKADSSRLDNAFAVGYKGKETWIQKLVAFFKKEDRNIVILMFKEFGTAVKNFQRDDIGEPEKIQFKLRAMSIIASLREKVSCGTLEHFDELVAPKLALLSEDLPENIPEVEHITQPRAPSVREPTISAFRAAYSQTKPVSMNIQDARLKAKLNEERILAEVTRSPSNPIVVAPAEPEPVKDHEYEIVPVPTSKADGLVPQKKKEQPILGLLPLRNDDQFLSLYEVSSGPGDFNGAPENDADTGKFVFVNVSDWWEKNKTPAQQSFKKMMERDIPITVVNSGEESPGVDPYSLEDPKYRPAGRSDQPGRTDHANAKVGGKPDTYNAFKDQAGFPKN